MLLVRFPSARRLAALCTLTWAAMVTPVAAQGWTSTYLGFIGKGGWVLDVNNLGQVVGTTADYHGFVTGVDGRGLRDLGTMGGNGAWIYGINDAGRITGERWVGASFVAFIADADGQNLRDLGTLGGCCSGGYVINASGRIAGNASTSAFLTGPDGGTMVDVGVGWVHGMNDSGQVVGGVGDHAFITGPSGIGMRDLGSLGDSRSIVAMGINNNGQVVGHDFAVGVHNIGDGPVMLRGFITGPDGSGMHRLGHLGGGDTWARAINDEGRVVGGSSLQDGSFHAFVTGADGVGISDLQAAVMPPAERGVFEDAWAINDQGEVALVTSAGHAYLLTPVTEPVTAALMLSGVLLLLCSGVLPRPSGRRDGGLLHRDDVPGVATRAG